MQYGPHASGGGAAKFAGRGRAANAAVLSCAGDVRAGHRPSRHAGGNNAMACALVKIEFSRPRCQFVACWLGDHPCCPTQVGEIYGSAFMGKIA
jgi:hypothetical protein